MPLNKPQLSHLSARLSSGYMPKERRANEISAAHSSLNAVDAKLSHKAKLQILQCNASGKHPNMTRHGTNITQSCESGFVRNNIIQGIRDRKIHQNMKI